MPINVENTRDSGVDPKTRCVTEGEVGDLDPPAPGHPEGSQPRTNTLLGTGPDPGEEGAKDRPRPPHEERAEGTPTNLTSMVNNHRDCDLQVRALEPAQGEAVYNPQLLPTVNDPLVCELQVRSPEAAQGKAMPPPPRPTTIGGQILVEETEGPPGTLTEPKIKPQENLYVLDSDVPGKCSGTETWGSNSNNMYGDYWYLESEEEDGSLSDLDDYANDTDLNVSLDSEEDLQFQK